MNYPDSSRHWQKNRIIEKAKGTTNSIQLLRAKLLRAKMIKVYSFYVKITQT